MVKEFEPEPLCSPLTAEQQEELDGIPEVCGHASARPLVKAPWMTGTLPRRVLNLASFNFTGMLEAPEIEAQARTILREYGVGSCSPPGFYGTSDMHIKLESRVATFFRKDSCIVYSQGFSTTSSVIPAFCKRGDVIVADEGVAFSIQKGLQLSRSHIHWYKHNDMKSLESVLMHLNEEQESSRQPLTRRFIVTEALFERDGTITHLPQIVELKKKYKFRMVLDESYSAGILGNTGRGLTELQNVDPDDVDIIVGNLAIAFSTAGGFCASTKEIVKHQRINGLSFVFSAAMPVMMANGSTVAMDLLDGDLSVFERLRENTSILRNALDPISAITITSSPESPLLHVQLRPSEDDTNLAVLYSDPKAHASWMASQQEVLKKIERLALNQGVWISRNPHIPSIRAELDQGPWARPSLRIIATSALSPAEMRQAADIVRASIVSVLGS